MEQGIVLESVWVAVGFVVFVALVWRKAGDAIGAMLDERSGKISSELKEASALREAALEELQSYQRLHREAAEEAKAILQSAEATAQRIRETAEKMPLRRSNAVNSRRMPRSKLPKPAWLPSCASGPLPWLSRRQPKSSPAI